MSTDRYLEENYIYCPRCRTKLNCDGQILTCSNCQFKFYYNPAPATAIAIFNGKEILLAKRKNPPFAGQLDTLGGFVNAGETFEAAALRELKEESNLEGRVVRYLDSFPDTYGDDGQAVINFYLEIEIIGGQIQAGDDVASLAYYPIKKIKLEQLAFSNTRQFIKKLQEGNYGKQ